MTEPLLEVKDLHAGYLKSNIVRGLSLSLQKGEGISIFGRNGVGKTTFLHSIMGFVKKSEGKVTLDGKDITHSSPDQVGRAGIAIVPQGRRVFPTLTVNENLTLGMTKDGKWNEERVFALLPRLKERRRQLAGLMSGGEQQMVAIGRALLRNPKVLVMDEPSEGLAPKIVQELGEVFTELRQAGITILAVEQNLELGLTVADRVVIMDFGQIVFETTAEKFRAQPEIAEKFLGVV